jgi:hypothetical protein
MNDGGGRANLSNGTKVINRLSGEHWEKRKPGEIKMPSLKSAVLKRTILAAAIVMQIATLPTAFGQSAPLNTANVPIANQVTVNQCSAGEPVALNGTLQVQYSVGTDGNGNNLFFVTASNNLTGAGQTTAAQYVAADSEDYTLSSTQSSTEGTVQLKADLVPQSSAGTSMTVVQQLQISVDTVGDLNVQVASNTTTCGS